MAAGCCCRFNLDAVFSGLSGAHTWFLVAVQENPFCHRLGVAAGAGLLVLVLEPAATGAAGLAGLS